MEENIGSYSYCLKSRAGDEKGKTEPMKSFPNNVEQPGTEFFNHQNLCFLVRRIEASAQGGAAAVALK